MNTSLARDDRPFLPSDIPADQTLVRAMTAHALAFARRRPPEEAQAIARATWERDIGVRALLTRSATAPADTSTSGWASQLAGRAVGSFISSLAPQSAAAQLIEAGTKVNLDGIATVTVPWSSTNPQPAFVAEGGAIPVGQGVFTGATIGPPSKLAVIEAFTRELAEHSADAAETVIGDLMREAASKALDAAVLSTAAADATRPAGILNGVSPISATSGANQVAMMTDVDALIAAVVAAGGGRSLMLFASPNRTFKLRVLAGVDIGIPIFPTPALTTSVVLIETGGFASGFGPNPDISTAMQATLHFEGSSPQAIGVSGSATLPIRSLWQTDTMAMRLLLDCAWAMRSAGLVQHVANVTW